VPRASVEVLGRDRGSSACLTPCSPAPARWTKIVDRPYQLPLGSIGSQRWIGRASLLTRLGDYLDERGRGCNQQCQRHGFGANE